MTYVKRALKWLFSHEPLIVAGVVAGAAVYVALRYGTKTDGTTQGETSGLVLTVFAVARQFVTSPAGRQALAAGIDNLPQLEADAAAAIKAVEQLRAEFNDPTNGGKGLLSVAKKFISDHVANHLDSFDQSVNDALAAVKSAGAAAVHDVTDIVNAPILTPAPTAPVDDAAASGDNITPAAPVEPVAVDMAPAAEPPAEVPAPEADPAVQADPFTVLEQIAAG